MTKQLATLSIAVNVVDSQIVSTSYATNAHDFMFWRGIFDRVWAHMVQQAKQRNEEAKDGDNGSTIDG